MGSNASTVGGNLRAWSGPTRALGLRPKSARPRKQPPVAGEPRFLKFLDQLGAIGDQVRQLQRAGATGVGRARRVLGGEPLEERDDLGVLGCVAGVVWTRAHCKILQIPGYCSAKVVPANLSCLLSTARNASAPADVENTVVVEKTAPDSMKETPTKVGNATTSSAPTLPITRAVCFLRSIASNTASLSPDMLRTVGLPFSHWVTVPVPN